ncbi:MAG: T9SS type A sorting domain-containing protein [Bacteroidia bacterium]
MKNVCKYLLAIGYWLSTINSTIAQTNLVMNPSFEELLGCPSGAYQADTSLYWGWLNNTTLPSGGWCKATLLSTCCTQPQWCGVPYSTFGGYQFPRTGNSYLLLAAIYNAPTGSGNKRDYIKGQLSTTLQAGKSYCLTFYYNAPNRIKYATNRFGAYIDNNTVASYSCCYNMSITPQVQNNPAMFMTDTLNWVQIQGSFMAIGNENTITLGNFVDSAAIQFQLFNSNGSEDSYYNIDDVSLLPIDLVPFAGKDTNIVQGDSTFIGRPFEIGLNDDCTWYVLGNSTAIDTIAGMWVKPTTTTSYLLEQNICGTVTYDTIKVSVNPVGIKTYGTKQSSYLVYPNPTSGTIYISTTNSSEVSLNVEMLDLTGRTIVKQSLPLANGVAQLQTNLVNGVYMIIIKDSTGKVTTQKLIINN